jgi:cytochrome c5
VRFKTYCVQCHALPSPKSHTPTHWENAFNVMRARMRMMAYHHQTPWGQERPSVKAPNDEEAEDILAYLKRHGLKPAPGDIALALSGTGAEQFRSTCATCHALPHPALHTSAEWPAVIERMRDHMRTYLKADIEDLAADEIAAFLAQAGQGRDVAR